VREGVVGQEDMNEVNMLPRIRAKTGQGSDNKWYFEISLWDFSGEHMIGDEPLGTFGPWDSEKIAKQEMNKAVELVCKTASEGQANGYIDMKNGGKFRKFQSDLS